MSSCVLPGTDTIPLRLPPAQLTRQNPAENNNRGAMGAPRS